MAEDEQQENSGSGWGWGWLSEAAKVAQEAYENNVKPTLVSMESTTSQFVQDVTKAIELDEESEEPAPQGEVERTKTQESSYPTVEVPIERNIDEEAQDDSLLGDALVGINFLGGMVKKLGEKLGDVDSMEASFKKGGQRLATAFEDAVSFITDDEETQRRPNETSSRSPAPSTPQKQADSAVPSTPSAFPATPGSTQTSTSTPSKAPAAAPTFSSLFEAKLGSVHLQTLENLSMQSSLQLQQIVRKLTPEQRDIVTKQQDELRAIYAPDVTETPMDLEHLALPAHVPDTLKSQLIALHQKCSNFYASRTASLQGFAIKAIDEFVLPVDNDLKTFSDLALSYRGKLQLEGLRQLAEFCAMAVGFVLQYAETITQAFKENPAMDLIEHARLIHGIALTIKVHAWAIVTPIIAAMKALGNSYRAKVPNLEADPNAKTAAQATLKRFTTGINNLQLDSATATSSVLDASRFTLAIIQHLHAQVVPQPEQSI